MRRHSFILQMGSCKSGKLNGATEAADKRKDLLREELRRWPSLVVLADLSTFLSLSILL